MQIHLARLHRGPFHQHGDAAARIQQLLLLFRLQQLVGKPRLIDHLPEAISRMGKVKTGVGRGLARVDTAEHHPQSWCKYVVDHDYSCLMVHALSIKD